MENEQEDNLSPEQIAALNSNTPLGADKDLVSEIENAFKQENRTNGKSGEDDEEDEVINSDEELMNAINGVDKKTKQQQGTQLSTKKTVSNTDSKNDTDDSDVEEDEDDEDEIKEDEDGKISLKKDPFKSTPKESKIVKPEAISSEIGKSVGFDITDEATATKAIQTINKFRKDSVNLQKVTLEFEEFKNFLASTPLKLRAALKAFSDNPNSNDWERVVSGNADIGVIDFAIDFDKADEATKLKIVNKYSDSEFEKLDDVPKAIASSVKNIFNKEKVLYQKNIDDQANSAVATKKQFDTALTLSMTSFETEFPDFDKKITKIIKSKFESGQYKNYFVDKNGNPTKDSIKRLAMAIIGEEKIRLQQAEINSLKKSKKNIKTAEELPDQRNKSKGGKNQNNGLPQEVQEQLAGLGSLINSGKSTY